MRDRGPPELPHRRAGGRGGSCAAWATSWPTAVPMARGSGTRRRSASVHRRLAIVDLSDAARQPMTGEDPRVWVVCNGEIYNFRELRATLEARGHRFRTQSDTEVLLAAYAAHGVDCLSRLRGMFAFALWDGGAAPAPARARSHGQEAALLPARRRRDRVRLGAEGLPGRPLLRGDAGPGGAVRLPHVPLRPGPRLGLRRRPPGAAGSLPRRGGRPGAPRAVLASPLPAEAPAVGGGRGGGAPGATPGRRALPARRRRPARGVPERRHRLERGRGAHGRGRRRPRSGPSRSGSRSRRTTSGRSRGWSRAGTAPSITSSSSGRRRSTSCPG